MSSQGGKWAALILVILMSPMAFGASITVNNASFEDPGTGIPGWSVTQTTTGTTAFGIDPNLPMSYDGGYTGTKAGFFYWAGPNTTTHAYGTMTAAQTLAGVPAQFYRQYTLEVDIGYRDEDGVGEYPNTLPIPESIELILLAGATELTAPVRVEPSPVYRNFVTYSVTYPTTTSVPLGDLQIQIVGERLNVTGSNVPSPASTYNPQNHNVLGEAFLPFDNVRLTVEPVPEPATVSMLAAAGLLMCFRRRGAR